MVANVETPFGIFQKPVEVLFLDTIESKLMTLRLVVEILNYVDIILLIRE